MLEVIITVGLKVLEFFLKKSGDSEAAQKLFYDFIDRMHQSYLTSVKLRGNAEERMKKLQAKPFEESK